MVQGLVAETLDRFGIEDYTEKFRAIAESTPSKDVFGRILNQEYALRHFVDSLGLDIRGRLNWGDAGVGKSMTVDALIEALKKLDKGEEITGEYAPQVTAYYESLKNNPRGDIYALWNPDDYYTPIVFRANGDVNGETIDNILEGELKGLLQTLSDDGVKIAREAVAVDRAIDLLSDAYIDLAGKYEVGEFSWEVQPPTRKKGVRLTYQDSENEQTSEWNKSMNEVFLRLSKIFNRTDADFAVRKVLGYGPEKLLEATELSEKLFQEFYGRMNNLIDEQVSYFRAYQDSWEEAQPEVADWYGRVARFFENDKKRKPLIDSFWGLISGLVHEPDKKDEKDKKAELPKDMGFRFMEIRPSGQEIDLASLLEPSVVRRNEDDRLIIRRPTIEDPLELFVELEGPEMDDSYPLHHQIGLGELAYADVVFIDDGISDVLADTPTRKAMLTFLNDGRVSAMDGKVQVEFQSYCHLFACETNNPFRRVVFEGTDPEFDDGMERRWSTTFFESWAEYNDKLVNAFPHILHQSTAETRQKLPRPVGFSPEASNLLFHYLIEEPELVFPMTIGQTSKNIFKPILARVSGKGKNMVEPSDVIDWIEKERDVMMENMWMRFSLDQSPPRPQAKRVGHVNGLYAATCMDAGGAFHLSASLTKRMGNIHSADQKANLMDETFHAGVLTSDMWFNQVFGPFRLEVELKDCDYSRSGGPSATAANTYAIMSEVGNIPVCQNTYTTGTVLDKDGNVGIIGGVLQKARGAWRYHNKMYKEAGMDVPQMRVMVPPRNQRALYRSMLVVPELQEAIENEQVIVTPHETVWEGFELISGMPRSEYEPIIRERIAQLTNEIGLYDRQIRFGPEHQ